MKKLTFRTVLRMISSFMIFFLTIGFAVSCCMMLFLNVIAETMGLEFTAENIAAAAKITLVNVLVITAIFTWIDYIRRRMTVDRPVRIITEAAEKITKGDLSVRIKPMQGAATEGFNRIITAVNAMTEELSGIETLRTDFISNVSHEMKTPLAVMQNYGTLLQSPGLSDEERIEYAKGVTDASRRLADMMTNILKLNRLENQQIRVELTDTAKSAIVEASYDPQYGARPLRRYVQHTVETMLSKRILRGDIAPGRTVTVDAADGELVMN